MSLDKNFLTIIPARLASTRLPNKPLADILGTSMIARVANQAKKTELGQVIIACDCQEIANEATKYNHDYTLTNPNLPSGTDRIFAAYEKVTDKNDDDIIINLQGDLPVIDPEIILATAKLAAKSDADITTAAAIISNQEEISDPNVVKIALAKKEEENFGNALYFSRAPIPYSKTQEEKYYHHIGIYAYKRRALEKFVSLSPSPLEKRESLEQLRALENGMKIDVAIVDSYPLSVDVQEDLDNVIKFLQKNLN